MHVQYPMMFKLSNPKTSRRTHCSVLEFSSQEGRCYIPHWMMQNLVLSEGDLVVLRNLQLPKAQFVRFRPHSKVSPCPPLPESVLFCYVAWLRLFRVCGHHYPWTMVSKLYVDVC